MLNELRSRLKSAKYGSTCNFDIFHWDERKGEARLQVDDMGAVFALWRTRHKSPLRIDNHTPSWDVAVADTYEEKRILVEGLPEGITPYNLEVQIQDAQCVAKHVEIQPILLEGNSKAVIYFDDTIVDSSLVDELNESGSEYEGDGEKYTRLHYSLIPTSRSVQLKGLDPSVDRGTLRNYFNTLHDKVNLERPLLVDDIRVSRDGLAVVRFRTAEGKI